MHAAAALAAAKEPENAAQEARSPEQFLMIIAGIDPGLSGAVALLDAATGAVVDLFDMPTLALSPRRARRTMTLAPD
jgi:predicted RNase H-like nuclease (RuvC/YqgF family)